MTGFHGRRVDEVIGLRIHWSQEMYHVISPPLACSARTVSFTAWRFRSSPCTEQLFTQPASGPHSGLPPAGDLVARKGTPGAASCTSVAHLRVRGDPVGVVQLGQNTDVPVFGVGRRRGVQADYGLLLATARLTTLSAAAESRTSRKATKNVARCHSQQAWRPRHRWHQSQTLPLRSARTRRTHILYQRPRRLHHLKRRTIPRRRK
jgi:hypothetical protein